MAVSAKETRYFDLLFAFHITKENYRQAARAMYLQAQQVRKLEDGLNSLNIQEAALLMAINCLKLAKVRKTFSTFFNSAFVKRSKILIFFLEDLILNFSA